MGLILLVRPMAKGFIVAFKDMFQFLNFSVFLAIPRWIPTH
jgi:hypothetical protein